MESHVRIFSARPKDVGVIGRIVDRAIRTGCAPDHGNDQAVVQAWAGLYTQPHIDTWLSDPSLHLCLGYLDRLPVGVAMALPSGDVCLCHVQPEFCRRGVGQGLMAELERRLVTAGCEQIKLLSTRTALRFYLRQGYGEVGRCLPFNGLSLTPMVKSVGRPHRPLEL